MSKSTNPGIYRFKLSCNALALIEKFTNVHKYDESDIFRDHWENWTKENVDIIRREKVLLEGMGYKGNLEEKMYKSARYYFKNKPNEKKQNKQRRQYIHFDKLFLADMDKHVIETAFIEKMKPSVAYNNFTSQQEYSNKIDIIVDEFEAMGWLEVDILKKVKKTYKNRYFIQQKSLI
jgi:hypothetical protein|tara:strand:+ start:221 stop:751 length:531 start_codon:yes stop_codon:yes gene_type:complete